MLLKKLSLHNFRPFKGDHEIVFSTDKEKNVTLVMAGNGAGKTTLAQAFQWVLYGRTEGFKNKSVLNSLVEGELEINSSAVVKVELEISHNGVDYIISRKQNYKKDSSGSVKQEASEIEISNKMDNGGTDFLNESKNISLIASILPESLAKYFFFDGERIDKMAGEVKEGKSSDFKEAVQNILGLTALNKAIEHMNPSAPTSVIGRYNAKLDEESDDKTKEQRAIIYSSNEKIEKNNERISELTNQINYYSTEIENIKNLLLSFTDAEKLQKELNQLNNNLINEKKAKSEQIDSLVEMFSYNTFNFMSNKLIMDALGELKDTNKIDKGIPDITKDTIDFLIKNGKCICGQDLSDHTSDYVRHLYDLLDYIPPESLGTSIDKFKSQANTGLKSSESYYSTMQTLMSSIRMSSNRIEELEDHIGNIDKKILDSSNNEISDLKNRQNSFEKILDENNKELDDKKIDNGILEKKINDAQAELDRLQLNITTNKEVKRNLLYAEKIYEIIKNTYESEEKKVRDRLKEEINELFEELYDGGMTINVDEKYRITTFVTDLDENTTSNLDANTARSYSIIFAFIVSVINLAKKKMKEDENTVITDEYPLVMDAPLSSFDQKRIDNICRVIPSIARQVIIFIKDTDGNIAKKDMADKIGIEYDVHLKDKNFPVDSVIKKVGEN